MLYEIENEKRLKYSPSEIGGCSPEELWMNQSLRSMEVLYPLGAIRHV